MLGAVQSAGLSPVVLIAYQNFDRGGSWTEAMGLNFASPETGRLFSENGGALAVKGNLDRFSGAQVVR